MKTCSALNNVFLKNKTMHIITYLLSVLDTVKIYHWMTTSHPRHVASDKLHERLSANIDRFVEVMIGKYGRPSKDNIQSSDIRVKTSLTDSTVVAYLDSVIKFLTKDIHVYINKDDVDLLTIRDEMVADLNQTKYLFTLR